MEFGGCVFRCVEPFPFDLFVVLLRMPCLLSYIMVFVGPVTFASRSGVGV